MKKKLFTLMMLLVCIGGGEIWGADIVASYTFDGSATSGTNVAGTNCTVSYYKIGNSGSNIVTVSDETFYKFTGDDAYVTIKLTGGESFAEGDKLTIIGYMNSTSAAKGYIIGSARSSGTDITQTGTKAKQTFTFTLTAASINEDGSITLWRKDSNTYIRSFSVTHSTLDISSQAFTGVKVDGSALTANSSTNGYTIASTTIITLSDDIQYLTAPTDITLTNHITFTDKSTVDDDVDVTFDGTVENGYFTGTATIGETVYTVKVKKDVTPTIALSSATGTISLKSYEATGTAKVTLTGANLANGTFNAPTASGVTVTPATVDITDGTIDQEFTITPTATTAAETVLAFAYTGATTQNYTLNYSKTAQRTLTKTNVTGSTTWDWSKAYNDDVKLDDTTSPTKSEEFLLSNLAEVKNDGNFNAQALSVICEFATRKQGEVYMLQGNKVAFTTTVPGIIKVTFSNTGNRNNDADGNRYLYVNGENTGVSSYQSSSTKEAVAYVAAGEVVLTAKTGSDTETMIRFIKIEFETLADADAVTVTDAGYATVVLSNDAFFEATTGVTAYAAKADGDKITLTEVKAAPANTPLVIKGAKASYQLHKASSISPAAVTDNDLVAGPVTGDGSSYYVLGKDADGKLGFGLLASGSTLPGTKAYIPASKFTSAPSFAYFDGETTGVSEVRSQKEDVRGEYFNLNGQRVAQPTKGLYIVNGRKVVVK